MTLRTLLAATIALLLLVPSVALAHDERESSFPDGSGSTPTYRAFDEDAPRLVVCKDDSDDRIAEISDLELRTFNEARLAECAHEHIQAAVDEVEAAGVQGTTIYVLPGEYREEPSHNPACTEDYDDEVVEYDLVVSCGEVVNLITVAGDDPEDDDITCDNALCDLQIEGTGEVPQDTKVVGGFNDEGDWVKHNGLKADRADGFALVNMAFELFRENAIYVHETDGYLLDRVEANFNDLYGILTFTSDHGVISNCETHHNGDSGVYPGSAADVNQEGTDPLTGITYTTGTGPLERWAVEIFNCNTHHNALGFSGTAGNSVWFHDNNVHHNGAGYVTDSFVGGHPGMPQDHAFLENNRIWANNVNYYPNVQDEDGPCGEKPADVGYEDGVVCPAFPVPVGTGVLIAGGNHNLVRTNQIYDNWRNGVMLLWVPGSVRGDFEPASQYDTSNDNHYRDNHFGEHPDGWFQPNGIDVWWDDQGTGNCWQGNTTSAEDGELTHNALAGSLPDCDSGGSSGSPFGTKTATIASCATYNRSEDPPPGESQNPPGCDWFATPAEPEGREAAPGEEEIEGGDDDTTTAAADSADDGGSLAATGGGSLLLAIGLGALIGGVLMRRRSTLDDGAAA